MRRIKMMKARESLSSPELDMSTGAAVGKDHSRNSFRHHES